jgi:hypothetical protein
VSGLGAASAAGSSGTVILDRDTLDRAGRATDRAVRAVLDTQAALLEGDPLEARQSADAANEAAQSAYLTLIQAGASVPNTPAPVPVPLHLLDTPATRRLLDALQYAMQCAQDVDRERGWTIDGTPSGEGIGMTDSVGDVYERFRQQVEGPKGRE